MNWIKQNLFNVLNLVVLIYVIYELQSIKTIALQTSVEAEMSNIKLDYVESDINSDMVMVDSIKRKMDSDTQKKKK